MTKANKQVYLLKENQRAAWCDGDRKTTHEYQFDLALFQPQLINFKHYPYQQTYQEKEIRVIKEAIELVPQTPVDLSWIRLLAKYDGFYETYTILLKVHMKRDFIKKLSTEFSEPKLYLEGTFTSRYRAANGNFLARDKNLHHFSACADLKEEQAIIDFEGASKLTDVCNKSPNNTLLDFKYSVLFQWTESKLDFEASEVNVLEKLFNEKLLTDCCLVSSNNTEVLCHRNVLAAHSDVFHAMLTSGFKESGTNRIEMIDVSEDAINVFLAYLYKKEINTDEITEELCLELLQTAHKYNVSALEKIMLEWFYHKPDDSFNMDLVLSLYFMTVNVDAHHMLCEKMLTILKRNAKTLSSSSIYQDLVEKNPKEAAELTLKILVAI